MLNQNNVDVVRRIAGNVAIDGFAASDMRVMSVRYEGNVLDKLSFSELI
jgi:hypothetical protein